MYRTCMFCTKDLGRNEVVEHFPVGTRLAFDSQRGRLWVVCRKCERWNLTPIEERWEAVEECELLFERTRIRAQTDNVGLAKLGDGTTLVRIGEPMRSEFAAWRYGDQFGRRRKKAFLVGGAVAVGLGAFMIGGIATGAISGAALGQSGNIVNAWMNGRTLARVRDSEGKVVKLKRPLLMEMRIVPTQDEQGWGVRLDRKKKDDLVYFGEEAREVAGRLMAQVNAGGGRSRDVQTAVQRIEDTGHPEQFLQVVTTMTGGKGSIAKREKAIGQVSKFATPDRLALEMALHEETERRALQGELWLLEQRWQQAEEIAEIADNLLTPDGADAFVETHRTSADSGDTRHDPERSA